MNRKSILTSLGGGLTMESVKIPAVGLGPFSQSDYSTAWIQNQTGQWHPLRGKIDRCTGIIWKEGRTVYEILLVAPPPPPKPVVRRGPRQLLADRASWVRS